MRTDTSDHIFGRLAFAAWLGVVCGTSAGASDGLFPEKRFFAGRTPAGAELADINADGELDVIAMNDSYEYFATMFGVGDGTFEEPVLYDTGFRPRAFTVGDVNGDDIPDLFYAQGGNAQIRMGVGDGTFTGSDSVSVEWTIYGMAVGDVAGSEHPDLICAGWLTGVQIFVGNGDGTFDHEPRAAAGVNSETVLVHDLDGDGLNDIVVTNSVNYRDDMIVVRNIGDGAFAPAVIHPTGEVPYGARVSDIDGDEVLDILVLNRVSQDFSLFVGNGDGTFAGETRIAAGFALRAFELADADEDGRLDIICTDADRNALVVLRSVGDGTFAEHEVVTAGSAPRNVWFVPLDDDTTPDLVAVNYDSRDVSVHRGLGGGRYVDHPRTPFDFSEYQAAGGACADFDGDGFFDVASVFVNPDGIGLAFGDGEGGFRSVEFRETPNYTPVRIATGDMDGDQLADLVIATTGVDAAVLLGNGDGTFAPEMMVSIGMRLTELFVADMNGDHLDDIVGEEYSGDGRVSVSLSIGAGFVWPPVTYKPWNSLYGLSLVDFDGDGDLDPIATCTYFDGVVYWESVLMPLINQGDGSLVQGEHVLADHQPEDVCVADFDGDGNLDLAAVNLGSDSVSVRYRRDGGSFGPIFQYPVGWSPQEIAAADMDRDGHIDLVITEPVHGAIGVLRGTPTSWFEQEERYATGGFPSVAGIVDADGDGDLDVIAVNSRSRDLSVLRNQTIAPAGCPADLDANGVLNFDDIDAFVAGFLGGDLLADLDGNGTLNFDDIDLFVNAFLAGCG